MIKQLVKPLVLILFFMALLSGNHLIAMAEPFDNNVKDCFENPEKCDQADNKDAGTDSKNSGQSRDATVGVSAWDFIKMIAALVFVIGLIYFLLRFVNAKSRSYQQTKLIQHLGGSPLGGNRSIQMVKVGDRLLVLGVGDDIKLLKEITDEEEYNRFIDHYEDQMDQLLQPKDIISKLMNKWQDQKNEASTDSSGGFKQVFEKRLEDMKSNRHHMLKDLKDKENQRDE
ncbi:flagellar protein FliO/FliZ [Bacillus ectoiniformans]|uniref:flagellar biosynthetic protein FliO n=1 Tax=Bacillus ectoiniformans TaxID=1494429 RepID=UPI001957891D|nr:flagellar biosynthetic protein FliO [Bacillus ectoiniformans]MBM7647119.1 flagellar protein FliO/FliZ [Bacillus ectoiniformans]